ncbi:MAG: hypothetical protein KGL39_38670 [Patescibacteria group bacterium]|nr:hypothetical protein [Patescibacteria group bacterium]
MADSAPNRPQQILNGILGRIAELVKRRSDGRLDQPVGYLCVLVASDANHEVAYQMNIDPMTAARLLRSVLHDVNLKNQLHPAINGHDFDKPQEPINE